MDEGQIVARLPLVADEQATVSIVPAVGALHDPSSWFAASAAHQGLFTAPADVRRHVAIPDLLLGVRVVVPLVEAEVVRTTWASRASMNDSVECGAGHPLVVNVGGGQLDADRDAAAVGQDVAFSWRRSRSATVPWRRICANGWPLVGAGIEIKNAGTRAVEGRHGDRETTGQCRDSTRRFGEAVPAEHDRIVDVHGPHQRVSGRVVIAVHAMGAGGQIQSHQVAAAPHLSNADLRFPTRRHVLRRAVERRGTFATDLGEAPLAFFGGIIPTTLPRPSINGSTRRCPESITTFLIRDARPAAAIHAQIRSTSVVGQVGTAASPDG
jgi:hypothetical protein